MEGTPKNQNRDSRIEEVRTNGEIIHDKFDEALNDMSLMDYSHRLEKKLSSIANDLSIEEQEEIGEAWKSISDIIITCERRIIDKDQK